MDIKAFLHRHDSVLIAVFFVLMGIISVAVLASTHLIYFNTDLTFHWYRLNELHFDLLQHTLPQFDTHTTTPYGLATMTYYPYVALLPFSLLTFFIKRPVALIYTIYFLATVLRYMISYFSYKAVNDSKRDGLIFAILYSSSSIVFAYMIRDGDLGVLLAMTFLPVAFFGMLNLLKNGRWLMLSFGLTMVIFSHVLSAFMLIGLLILMTVLNLNRFWNWKRLGGLILAVGLSVVTTTLFWFPVLRNLMLNDIVSPRKFPNFPQGLLSQLTATINHTYGLVEIFGFLSIIFIKKMNWKDIQLWIIGTLSLFINVPFIGNLVVKLVPQILAFQFSYRFSFIAHIVFAYLLTKFIGETFRGRNFNYLPVCFLVPVLLFMQVGNQYNTRFMLGSRHLIDTPHYQLSYKAKGPYEIQHNYNNRSFADVRHSNYNLDYAPKAVQDKIWMFVQYRTIELNKHDQYKDLGHFDPTDQGIQVSPNHRIERLVLPMVEYHGYQYDVTMNGKQLPKSRLDGKYTNKNALVSVKDVPAGHYTFQIEPKVPSIVDKAFRITLIGALIHVLLLILQGCWALIHKKRGHHADQDVIEK